MKTRHVVAATAMFLAGATTVAVTQDGTPTSTAQDVEIVHFEVQPADNFYKIAQRLNPGGNVDADVEYLMAANGYPQVIYPNQVLVYNPAKLSTPSTTTSTTSTTVAPTTTSTSTSTTTTTTTTTTVAPTTTTTRPPTTTSTTTSTTAAPTTTTTTTTLPPPLVPPVMVGATIDVNANPSGCTTHASCLTAFETQVGAPIDIVRAFTSTFPTSFSSIGSFNAATNKNHRVISVKGNPTATQWNTFLASIPQDGFHTWVVINHEPENDGDTPATWKAKQALMLQRIEASGRADLHPMFVLMFWLEFDGCSNTQTPPCGDLTTTSADWFPAQLSKWTMGLDPYDQAQVRSMSQLWTPTVQLFRAAGGKDFMITETGTRRTGTAGANWIRDAFLACRIDPGCKGIMWFHSNVGATGNWWLLTGTMSDAFGDQVGVPR